jgi:hypothetical protein
MKNENILGVALVKEACPLCGHIEDGPILLNTRLNPSAAKKIESMHGQTIGYMDKPCKDCQDIMDKAILLIGVVEAKTDDYKNPYRSGNKWGVTEDFIRKAFPENMVNNVIKKRICFFPVEAASKMGFPDCNLNA